MFVRSLFKFPLSPARWIRGVSLRRCSCLCPEVPNYPSDAPVRLTVLENGIQVATQETLCPLTSICLYIDAGPRYETTHTNGITHFIEHLAYKGLCDMNKCAYEECALYSGIRFTAKTTQEYQVFQASCPVECTPKALEMLCKIITSLNPTEEVIKNECYNLELELNDADRDPKALVFENLLKTAFQGTSLGQPVIGPTSNYANFTGDFVTTYIAQHYQPWRLTFAISGYVTHELMVSTICSYLGCIVPLSCTPDYGARRYTGSSMIFRDDSMPFAHVCMAVEVGGYSSADYLVCLVMKHLVGSWNKSRTINYNGNVPELAKRCTDTQLCDSFESFYLPFRDVGLWGIHFVSERENIEDMVENILNVWMHVGTTTVFPYVSRASKAAILEAAWRREGSINASRTIGEELLYKGQYRSMQSFCKLVGCMKASNVLEVAEPRLYDRCPVISAVGPTEAVPEYNRVRAGMYWLRL